MYETVDTFGPVTKKEQTVQTPMVEERGYYSEENRRVRYEVEDYYVIVSKISNNGWCARLYEADGRFAPIERAQHLEEDEAHAAAREMIESVL